MSFIVINMNFLLLLGSLSFVIADSEDVSFQPKRWENRIIHGRTVNIAAVPYQLSLQYYQKHICGASIISKEWALTAAHCVYPNKDPSGRTLISNSSYYSFFSRDAIIHNVSFIDFHENYGGGSDYDVAVLRISGSFISENSIATFVRLAEHGTTPRPKTEAFVTGWGYIDQVLPIQPTLLQGIVVPVVDRLLCSKSFHITERMMCAGYLSGKSPCNGDSGGPLVINGENGIEQVGIVSFGQTYCGVDEHPGVYTNVGTVRGWIKNKTHV